MPTKTIQVPLTEQLVGRAVAMFHADFTATLLESEGAVSIGTRAPCAGGHGPGVECDLCRGECLGRGEHPPDAVALPIFELTAEDKVSRVRL